MSTDLNKLQGTWAITSVETEGQHMAGAALAGMTIVIDGSRFTSLGMGQTYEGTIEVDQRKKANDLVFTSGPQTGTRNLGIYKFGKTGWTLCLATYGDTRPRAFAAKKGTGIALETLEREASPRKAASKKPAAAPTAGKPQRSAAEDATAAAPSTPLEGDWAMVSGVFSGKPLAADMVRWCSRTTRGSLTTVVD